MKNQNGTKIYQPRTAPVSIVLKRQNFEHKDITVLLRFSCARLEFTSLLNKPVEKNMVFKHFDVLFFKYSDWKTEKKSKKLDVLPQEHNISISQKMFHNHSLVFWMNSFKNILKNFGFNAIHDFLEKGESCWQVNESWVFWLTQLFRVEMRIFGPKLITIFWLESLSSKYKTWVKCCFKKMF